MLPSGLPDEAAIAKAHLLFSKRKGPFDGFEIWDGGRVVFRYPSPPATAFATATISPKSAPP
jgi:hypothetical protein